MSYLFDIIIAVDWSAKSSPSPRTPSADAIWIAVFDIHNNHISEQYFQTRHACKEYLLSILQKYVESNDKVLLGYDFDFGFPRGLGEALGGSKKETWKFLWEYLNRVVEDNEQNENNRFEVAAQINKVISHQPGPFWGCPRSKCFESLAYTSPQYPFLVKDNVLLRKKRWCEHREPRAQPVWKLLGTASVGGQSLLGIPFLYSLRNHEFLKEHSSIWPFETGFTLPNLPTDGPSIVHVEIWPGILSNHLDKTIPVRDQAQVRKTVQWLHEWDASGQLAVLMSPPAWVDETMLEDILSEEGWVIGSGLEGNIFPGNGMENKSESQGYLF